MPQESAEDGTMFYDVAMQKRFSAILMVAVTGMFFLLVALSSQAQIHGTPPSVTSFGGFSPHAGASVTSLGPNGFGGFRACCPVDGLARFGIIHHPRFEVGVGFGRPLHRRFRNSLVTVPVYVPYYPIYPAYGSYVDYSGYGTQAVTDAVTDSEPPAQTIFERRPTTSYPRYDVQDSRYGEHYLDEREGGRESTGENQARGSEARKSEAEAQPKERAPSNEPATVLVFRDGHRLEVSNYAIVGSTLYDFSANHARKIALSELDLQATVKVNDERGVEFRLPGKKG